MPRAAVGGMTYHALNRGNRHAEVFHKAEDYDAFLGAIANARRRLPVDVLENVGSTPNGEKPRARPLCPAAGDCGTIGRDSHPEGQPMTIQLSEESRRYVADQVAAGRFPSEQAVLEAALAQMRQQERSATAGEDPILGMFRNDTDLIDEVVDEAMASRERRPWRLPEGE